MWFFWVLVIAGVITGIVFFQRSKSRPTDARKRDTATGRPSGEPLPVALGSDDLDRADTALRRFERAVGNSNALYDAFAEISRAGGGIGTYEEQIRRGLQDSLDRMPRPWYWLAAVAEEADRVGNHLLVARICVFTEMWVNVYSPRMNLAGSMDAGLGSPPEGPRAQIATIGLAATASLSPGQAVAGNQTGTTTVRDTRLMCADALATLAESKAAGISEETSARALHILESGGDLPSDGDAQD